MIQYRLKTLRLYPSQEARAKEKDWSEIHQNSNSLCSSGHNYSSFLLSSIFPDAWQCGYIILFKN